MPSISISRPPHPPFSCPQTSPYPLKELAVSAPRPQHFTSTRADGGAGPGGRDHGGASGFSGWLPPLPRPLQDCVSVYNIYMYVLFPVLYGPCPLSGHPHKSGPQSLAAWFLDSQEDGGGAGLPVCAEWSPPTSATLFLRIFIGKSLVPGSSTLLFCYCCSHQHYAFLSISTGQGWSFQIVPYLHRIPLFTSL